MAVARLSAPSFGLPAWRLPASLRARFAIAGGAVMLTAMIIGGFYISQTATAKNIENAAASTGLLVSRLLDPYVDELGVQGKLGTTGKTSLDELLSLRRLTARFPHLDIWDHSGTIVYSRHESIIGLNFAQSDSLRAAFLGQMTARFTDLGAAEHLARDFEEQFLEIYIPLRAAATGDIVAVAEIHEVTDTLHDKITTIQRQVWTVLAVSTLLLMGSLYGIVAHGSRVIALQNERLRNQLDELSTANDQIERLNQRAQKASHHFVENTERLMKQVGADLHDGPAQLVALAAMKVDRLATLDEPQRQQSAARMKSLLDEAMAEIRAISKGLMLPEIQHAALKNVIRRAGSLHELRTATSVTYRLAGASSVLPPALNVCIFRFVQEGLSNAFWHAAGQNQTVGCRVGPGMVEIAVSDSGGGDGHGMSDHEGGLGLDAMRNRVESLGGDLIIQPGRHGGTRVSIRLPIRPEAA